MILSYPLPTKCLILQLLRERGPMSIRRVEVLVEEHLRAVNSGKTMRKVVVRTPTQPLLVTTWTRLKQDGFICDVGGGGKRKLTAKGEEIARAQRIAGLLLF